jgi:hypothetical protein
MWGYNSVKADDGGQGQALPPHHRHIIVAAGFTPAFRSLPIRLFRSLPTRLICSPPIRLIRSPLIRLREKRYTPGDDYKYSWYT